MVGNVGSCCLGRRSFTRAMVMQLYSPAAAVKPLTVLFCHFNVIKRLSNEKNINSNYLVLYDVLFVTQVSNTWYAWKHS